MVKHLVVMILAIGVVCSSSVSQQSSSDEFLRGYATAILQTTHQIKADVIVKAGAIIILNAPQDQAIRNEIQDALQSAPGVRSVRFEQQGEEVNETDWASEINESTEGLFPKGDLFEPLVADPWESRFFLSYRASDDMDNSGVVGFGEVLPLYRWTNVFTPGLTVQMNIEGGVFGHFNMENGGDLENTDFQVGFPFIFHYDDFTARVRYMHRSGHLGDDHIVRELPPFLDILGRQLDRNLVDLTLAYSQPDWRVYGGPVYIFDDVGDIDPLEMVFGGEYRPWSHLSIHPVFGVHFTTWEEDDWELNQRYTAGVEFKDWPFRSKALRLLLEYYNGRPLNFPAFSQDGDYVGVGVYLDL